MRYIGVFVGAFGLAFVAYAHVPFLVTQEDLHDIVTITDPELSQAHYGHLNGFPHTYEFTTDESVALFVEVLVPDITSSTNNVSGIIIREIEGSGRVTEVARLLARDAAWESFYEPFGGDTYRRGPSFEKEVEPGTYRIEVQTPDNIEKYVLVVGKREDFSGIGYFETVRRIAGVKEFFEKPAISIIESPFIFVPLVVLLLALFVGGWYIRRRRRANHVRICSSKESDCT